MSRSVLASLFGVTAFAIAALGMSALVRWPGTAQAAGPGAPAGNPGPELEGGPGAPAGNPGPELEGGQGFPFHLSLKAQSLKVLDLVGEVTAASHDGPNFEVDVRVRGKDATRDILKIESTGDSAKEVRIRFPLERETHYVYPQLPSATKISFTCEGAEEKSFLARLLGGGEGGVHVAASGKGLEVWADVRVLVPRGKKLELNQGVAKLVRADGLDGGLEIKVRDGAIEVRGLAGGLQASTGSGRIFVMNAAGGVRAVTGTGDVDLTGPEGDLRVATGNGDITATLCRARQAEMETGIGDVRFRGAVSGSFDVATGSGDVNAALEGLGAGPASIATGVGEITLGLPPDASVRVDAGTGVGGIEVHPGLAAVPERTGGTVRFQLGDGRAPVRLRTGSGSIRIGRTN